MQIPLLESNENLPHLLNQLPLACLVCDLDLVCAFLNPAAERTFGFQIDELRGKHPTDWIAPVSARSSFLGKMLSVLEDGETQSFECENTTKSGHVIICEWQLTPLRNMDGSLAGLLSFAKEITSLKTAETKLTAQMERLNALRTIDTAITSRLELPVLLNVVLQQVISQLKLDAAVVLIFDPEIEALKFAAGQGLRTDALQHTKLRLGEGYAGLAALQKKIVTIPNLDHRKTDFLRSPMFGRERFRSYACIPLIAQGKVIGVLEGFYRKHFLPDADWQEYFETLGRQAAIAIDNVNLFNKLQSSNRELERAYDNTLEGWSKALNLRDRNMEGHTQRVTDMTDRLADILGIGENERVHIRRGAILHDIGKLGVPDNILLKKTSLNEDEWDIMRQHPVMARDMLSPILYLRPALDIPYCHHEKWDGSGYPRGLRGEHIPLSARIFAVVDVFDALTSDRPYRKAWSAEQALGYIRAGTGSHFDPEVVNIFLNIFGLPE